jgi:hypothetical protein
MLDSWNQSIFCNIKERLQNSAMKLVHAERNGEAFDSQLVIGVRESYGMFVIFNIMGKIKQGKDKIFACWFLDSHFAGLNICMSAFGEDGNKQPSLLYNGFLTHFRPNFQNIFFPNCVRQFSGVFLKRKMLTKIFISGTVLYR